MPIRTSRLRDAVVLAIVAGACTSGNALAQDAQPAASPDATQLDTVTVTGSRIAIPGLTTNSPVTTIERDEIDRNQPVAAEDFLKQLPSAVPAIGSGTNNGTGGGATLDLRGIGSQRTLVLVDGRRMVPFNLDGVVDTNVIPVGLIQSVDLVTGGASAVYGADAVAGVANFILRRDFEGLELRASHGQSSKGDAARQNIDVTMGANLDDGRGNVALSLSRTQADPLLQGARPYGRQSLSSVTGLPEGSFTTVPSYFEAFNPDGGGDGLFGQIDPSTGLLTDDVATFNFNPKNYYQTPLDRHQATALARYDITDNHEAYAQVFYTRSDVGSSLAESGIFFETLDVPIGNAFIPQPLRQQLCTEFGIADCTQGNTTAIPLTIARRITEFGPRLNDFKNKTFQFTAGLRGDLGDNWRYDTYYTRGEADQTQLLINWGSLSKVRQALAAVDADACLDPSNGCVPLDVFGPEGSITPEMAAFINLDAITLQSVEQEVMSGSVSGDLGDFKMPWADYPIGVAFGLEHRRATASIKSDASLQIAGEVMGTGAPSIDQTGRFSLSEAYGELLLPIVSGQPGIHALTLEAGYRHSDFKVGANSEDYGTFKYGLEWAPIESLRFRGMAQRATRAPNINELFLPETTGLDNLAVDPCAGPGLNPANAGTPGTLENLCVQTGVPQARLGSLQQPSAGQANVLIGGNPALSPEKADTRTVGLVWQPAWQNDFALTLDYWKIEVDETISSQSIDDVINGCYSTALNPDRAFNDDCALVGRDPGNGSFNGSGAQGVALLLSNLGRIKTDGYDLGLRYGFGLPDAWGRLDLALDATKVNSRRFQATPTSVDRECVGLYSNSCGVGTYDFKSNLRAAWTIDQLELSLGWRYLSGIDEESRGEAGFLPAYSSIDAYSYFDLGVAYTAPFNARFQLTVNNLTDKQPPIVGNSIGSTTDNSGNTFPQYYDVLGRFVTLGVTFKF
ncbi:TonB-dependent receptor [Luteimonas sp. SMYT11W]|uniref:TonB-dependent receptor n=1 Tax=Luteimonas flava TaxID=3115822 RepID=A0ABU7WFM1_9GAMM